MNCSIKDPYLSVGMDQTILIDICNDIALTTQTITAEVWDHYTNVQLATGGVCLSTHPDADWSNKVVAAFFEAATTNSVRRNAVVHIRLVIDDGVDQIVTVSDPLRTL